MDDTKNSSNAGNDRDRTRARLATIERLRQTVIPLFLDPVPRAATLRYMFRAAGVPCFKSNAAAKRGGGTVFYSVAGVEKLFRARMVGGAR